MPWRYRAAQLALKIIYLIERRFGEGYSRPGRWSFARGNEFSFARLRKETMHGGETILKEVPGRIIELHSEQS